MKLDSNGAIQWVTQLGATTKDPGYPSADHSDYDYCSGIAVDSSGNVFCAGETRGSIGEANANPGLRDAFVMKLDSNGAIQWVTQLGDTTKDPDYPSASNSGEDACEGIAVDNSDNVYCAGYTYGDMGEGNDGGTDAFVMKLDSSSGAIQWVTQLEIRQKIQTTLRRIIQVVNLAGGVAVDNSGSVYCAGYTTRDIAK